MIGVNQRDLHTFEVDHGRAVRMARLIPDGVVKVAESGVRDADDARALRDAGYDAILVGETLVTAADPGRRSPSSSAEADAKAAEPIARATATLEYRSTGMFVKICGITNEDDALFAVAMGADAVGFIFAPSPRQIAPQQVYDITRRLPPEVLTVGVFRDELPSRVIEVAHQAGVKAVQLHGRETPEQTTEVGREHPLGDQGLRRQFAGAPHAPTTTAPTWSWSTPRRRAPARCSTGAWRPRCPTACG